MDGGGVGGDLYAGIRLVAAVAGLAPVVGDFDAIAARVAAVAGLEPLHGFAGRGYAGHVTPTVCPAGAWSFGERGPATAASHIPAGRN
ncbi:hypothetical protein SFR_1735 [Streptomyces sp. FR-008]|nr:hypothetical protein SFR_1735 [Streptomyces sp. FR-008]